MIRAMYSAASGMSAQELAVDNIAHNLANAGTSGYKSETVAFRSAPVQGPGLPTRAYAVASSTGADLSGGSVQRTGRDLDVAVSGSGFIAVQARDGTEAYTRDGGFELDTDGQLQTRSGLPVLGEGGPITIPQDSVVSIGRDGTVSVTTNGQSLANVTVVGQIKLANPQRADIVKGSDGLFRTRSGAPADTDPAVELVSGAVEGSNVNAVASMVDMINLARQFDMHMKMLQNVDGNAQRATQLLTTSAS